MAAEPAALEHMMEQLLEGSHAGEQRLLQEMMEVETNRMDTENTQQQPSQQRRQVRTKSL